LNSSNKTIFAGNGSDPLKARLAQWAAAQRPPAWGRAVLLRNAKEELAARQQNPRGFTYSVYGQGLDFSPLILSQNLLPFLSIQLRVRY
jgi:hypothetical protein